MSKVEGAGLAPIQEPPRPPPRTCSTLGRSRRKGSPCFLAPLTAWDMSEGRGPRPEQVLCARESGSGCRGISGEGDVTGPDPQPSSPTL